MGAGVISLYLHLAEPVVVCDAPATSLSASEATVLRLRAQGVRGITELAAVSGYSRRQIQRVVRGMR